MAEGAWLFEVGVDTTKADQAVKSFVERTTKTLNTIPTIQLKADTKAASSSVETFVSSTARTLKSTPTTLTVTADTTKATASLRELRTELNTIGKGSTIFPELGGALENLSKQARGASMAAREAGDAYSFFGGTLLYSLRHVIEYQVIMEGVVQTIRLFKEAMSTAANVELEQTIQKLYNPSIDLNESLKASIIIARQWGADITDVQQVIGLWTKNTGDLQSAIYLANEAEKMHRASGVETQEVYKDSIALSTQLGIKLKELPGIYDMVAEASLQLAVPLKQLGRGGKMEAMKDLFGGLAESMATTKSMGFDVATSIAIVGAQIQGTGENGKEAAKNLSNMFAALEGAGKNRYNFEKIMNLGDMSGLSQAEKSDKVLQAMRDHAQELRQALADKGLGVKTQQFETLQTFLAALTEIQKKAEDIRKNSTGKLNLVSEAEMSTAVGQFERLKSTIETTAFAIGSKLLPYAMEWMDNLNHWLPMLDRMIPTILSVADALKNVGVAILAQQAWARIAPMMAGVSASWTTALTAARASAAGQVEAQTEVQASVEKTMAVQQEAATLQAEQLSLFEREANAQLSLLTGLTAEEEAYAAKTAAAAAATGELAIAQDATVGAMGRMATGLGVGVRALGGFIGAAAAAAAPVLALVGAVQMAMGALDSLDARKNFQLSADLAMSTNPLQKAGTAALHSGQILGLAAQGKTNKLNSYQALLQKDIDTWNDDDNHYGGPRHDPGSAATQVHHQLVLRNEAQARHDQEGVDAANDTLKTIITNQHDDSARKPYSIQADYKKMIADATANMPGLNNRTGNGAQPLPDASAPAGSKKGIATPAQDINQEVQGIKGIASAEMTNQADIITGKQDIIESLKTIGELEGWTKKNVDELTKSYDAQAVAARKQSSIAHKEANDLHVTYDEAVKKYKAKPGTVEYDSEQRSLHLIEAAWIKAEGAAAKYRDSVRKINADAYRDEGVAQASATLTGAGLGKNPAAVKSKADEIVRQMNLNKNEGLAGMAFSAADATIKLKALETVLEGLIAKANGPARAALQALLQGVKNDAALAADKTAKVTEEILKIGDAVKSISEKADTGNAALEKAIFDPYGDKDGVTAMLAAFKQINDEKSKLAEDQRRLVGLLQDGNDEVRKNAALDLQAIAAANGKLDLQKALVIEAQREAAIRNSIQYKATESVISKYGSNALDSYVTKSFSVDKGDKGSIRSMAADWTKQVLNDSWTKMAKAITDQMFGATPGAKKPEDVQLNAAQIQLQAANLQLGKAGGGPGAAGGTSGGFGAIDATTGTLKDILNPNGTVPVSIDGVNGSSLPPQGVGLGVDIGGAGGGTGGGAGGNPALSAISALLNPKTGALGGIFPSLMAMGGASAEKQGGMYGALGQGATVLGGLGVGLQAVGKNLTGGAAGTGKLLGKIGGIAGGVGETMGGFAQGGVGGGLQAGMGILSTEAAINPLLAASPGGMGIAVAGGLASMLLHHDDQSKMPDKYDTTAYGQANANLTGSAGANGQQFTENTDMLDALGGKTQIQYIEEQLANGKPKGMGDATYAKLLGEFGSSSSGAGTLQHDAKNIGMEWISGANGTNGQEVSYTQLAQDAQDAINKLTQSGPLAPLISMNAYGAGAGYKANANNMYGLTAAEQKSMRDTSYGSLPGASAYQGTPYATPGVGSGLGGSSTTPMYVQPVANQPIQVNSTITLDGRVVAQSVNSVNASTANAQGKIAA